MGFNLGFKGLKTNFYVSPSAMRNHLGYITRKDYNTAVFSKECYTRILWPVNLFYNTRDCVHLPVHVLEPLA